MPEAEIRLGKACQFYFRPFARKTGNQKEVTEVTETEADVEARFYSAWKGCSARSHTPQALPPPDRAGFVPSARDSPSHSRKETRHPPEIRNSRAAEGTRRADWRSSSVTSFTEAAPRPRRSLIRNSLVTPECTKPSTSSTCLPAMASSWLKNISSSGDRPACSACSSA
jgi:hypothetical protein